VGTSITAKTSRGSHSRFCTLLQELDSSDENEAFEKAPGSTTLNDAAPKDFNLYLNTTDEIPEGQMLIQWWGVSLQIFLHLP
jgi:hypothetical protein